MLTNHLKFNIRITTIMKKIALLLFALCTGTVHTRYGQFESIGELYDVVGQQSAKIKACLEKHCFFENDPGSMEFVVAIKELLRISEHELMHNPTLKKQFIVSLWLGLAERCCFETKEYAQAIDFCDIALELDPDNGMIYGFKSAVYKEWGNVKQADIYRKIADEKGFDIRHYT